MTILCGEAEGDALPPDWVWAGGTELKEKYAVPSAFEGALQLAGVRLDRGE